MNQAITFELQFFLISVLWGAILLLVYDFLRILRRIIKHDSFFIAVEDLIFWVAASLFIFSMMYRENNGVIRGFSIMGMAIGMVLYHYIISEFLVNIITKFIKTLIRPLAFACKKVRKFVLILASKGKKALIFLFSRLKKYVKSVRIALNKKKQQTAAKKQKRLEKKALLKKQKEVKKQKNNQNTKKHNAEDKGRQEALNKKKDKNKQKKQKDVKKRNKKEEPGQKNEFYPSTEHKVANEPIQRNLQYGNQKAISDNNRKTMKKQIFEKYDNRLQDTGKKD